MLKFPREIRALPLNILLGKPLPNDPSKHEDHQLGVVDGAATAGSDSTSSTTYTFETVITALMALGAAAYSYGIPITLGLIGILLLVGSCYVLGIMEYPEGGGAYKIALANLTVFVALVAAASLLMNYILTVSVSDAALVDQLLSIMPWLNPKAAIYDFQIWKFSLHLEPLRVIFNLLVIGGTCVLNLRGPKSAGKPVSFLYFAFLGAMSLVFLVGFTRMFLGNLPPSTYAGLMTGTTKAATPSLLIIAFIRGCILVSGAEAVSTEGPFFKQPKGRTAVRALTFLCIVLGVLALGIAVLGSYIHVAGVDEKQTETVVSQIIRAVFSGLDFSAFGWIIPLSLILYVIAQSTSIGILFLGGNTPFTAFSALVKFLAEDRYLHHQLTGLGRRLELRRAIFFLTGCASLITVIFQSNTLRMLGLYGIGVFLGYIIYMGGLSVLFFRRRQWVKGAMTAICAVVSFGITLGFLIINFMDGAWITLLGIGGFVTAFLVIKHRYAVTADKLTIMRNGKAHNLPTYCQQLPKSVYVALVSGAHQSAVDNLRHAVAGASAAHTEVRAVHFDDNPDPTHAQRLLSDWNTAVRPCLDIPLEIVPAVYRDLQDPLRDYILRLQEIKPEFNIELVCGQLDAPTKLEQSLHRDSWRVIHKSIHGLSNVTLKIVPFNL